MTHTYQKKIQIIKIHKANDLSQNIIQTKMNETAFLNEQWVLWKAWPRFKSDGVWKIEIHDWDYFFFLKSIFPRSTGFSRKTRSGVPNPHDVQQLLLLPATWYDFRHAFTQPRENRISPRFIFVRIFFYYLYYVCSQHQRYIDVA